MLERSRDLRRLCWHEARSRYLDLCCCLTKVINSTPSSTSLDDW
uniref:Uncharacterized protein n=1 Tax=Utricularia reniformis TaxID=192314 RepID=A0A1Y0B0A0_9LAMI|nr:hypothetical protein AEK19_MT0607 [Utricularia reniformis]ART30862.1 hypothetical protein AEK19_MT0607 [Utricularia reniformis]